MASNEEAMNVDSGQASQVRTPTSGTEQNVTVSGNQVAELISLVAQQQATLSALMTANGANTNISKPVRSVDVKLDTFMGGARSTSILQADQLIEFDKWYRLSMHKMRMYNLPEPQYAACLIANLDGPARASWFAKFPEAKDISAQEFYDSFCTLIPHYKLYCTTQYTTCTFTPSTIIDDVEKFMAYVRFSGILPDINEHHEVVCDMFFQKLSQSCSHLIEVARNSYGIDLKASDSLSALAEKAKAAARRYEVDYAASISQRKRSGAVLGQAESINMDKKKVRLGTTSTYESKKRKFSRPESALKETVSQPEEELLRKYKRCLRCAYKPRVHPNGELCEHECNAEAKAARVEAIRKDLAK